MGNENSAHQALLQKGLVGIKSTGIADARHACQTSARGQQQREKRHPGRSHEANDPPLDSSGASGLPCCLQHLVAADSGPPNNLISRDSVKAIGNSLPQVHAASQAARQVSAMQAVVASSRRLRPMGAWVRLHGTLNAFAVVTPDVFPHNRVSIFEA